MKIKEARKGIFYRDDWRCRLCRTSTPVLTLDHIIPLSLGGPRTPDWNIRATCSPCNSRRGTTLDLDRDVRHIAENLEYQGVAPNQSWQEAMTLWNAAAWKQRDSPNQPRPPRVKGELAAFESWAAARRH